MPPHAPKAKRVCRGVSTPSPRLSHTGTPKRAQLSVGRPGVGWGWGWVGGSGPAREAECPLPPGSGCLRVSAGAPPRAHACRPATRVPPRPAAPALRSLPLPPTRDPGCASLHFSLLVWVVLEFLGGLGFGRFFFFFWSCFLLPKKRCRCPRPDPLLLRRITTFCYSSPLPPRSFPPPTPTPQFPGNASPLRFPAPGAACKRHPPRDASHGYPQAPPKPGP